jgi:glycine/D-amino acid oxidase-like deaminating enzyme
VSWWLAQRGAKDVVLLEAADGLGSQSSAKSASILRSAMPKSPVRDLSIEGSRFLRRPPPDFARAALVDPCGVLLTGDASRARELEEWRRALESELAVRTIDAREARELAPHWRGSLDGALWVEDEGRIDVGALLAGYERGARERGVELRTNATVRAIATRGGRVRGVELDQGEPLDAAQVVIAAGGWAGKLAASAGSRIRVRPTRRHVLVTERDAGIDARWPIVWALGGDFYARPESGGLLMCACDEADVDPDDAHADPSVARDIAAKARSFVPDFAALRASRFWCGMRTFSQDEAFLVGPDPDVGGLIWAAGLGGHGLTASAPVGRIAADWIIDGANRDPLAHALSPARFAR